MGILDRVDSITAAESAEIKESIDRQRTGEIERGAWENLFVSMERSFYNIVDLSATSIRKLSTFALEDEDVRKQTGAGWIGRNAGLLAIDFGKRAADPELAPETDPEMMDKFAELLGTTVPYTAAAIGAAGIGFVAGGPVGAGTAFAKTGAGLASFSIMREEAYRNAVETGADEDTANIEANIVGGIQALLELAQIGGILRQSKTGGALLKSITMNARNKAWTQVLKSGGRLSMSMVRTMTEEALQEALQGTTSELVPKLLRGKEIEPGFAGRRLREAAGGALIGGVFGGIGSMAQLATQKGEAAHIPSRPEIEFDPVIEQQAAEEADTREEDQITGPTSDIPSESGIEFDEEVAEGETYSEAQVADSVVEGQEVEPIVEELSEPDVRSDIDLSIDKLNDAISSRLLGELREVTEIERTMERGKRTTEAEAAKAIALSEGATADEAQQAAKAELAGEYPEAVFPRFDSDEMSPMDYENIRRAIIDSKLRTFEQIRANDALNKLQDGVVPTPSELEVLGSIIGRSQAAKIIAAASKKKGKLGGILLELMNFPTTTLASFDVSMVGRQSITTLPSYPKEWFKAVTTSYKAALSLEYANQAMNDMDTDEWAEVRRRAQVFRSDIDGSLTTTEQQFYSTWAKRIPILKIFTKASERAAVVGMNRLRTSIFNKVAEGWAGTQRTDANYRELAEVVNASTGRGNVKRGGNLDKILPYLNAAFFSPRYVLSRFELAGKTGKSLVDLTTGKSTPAGKILAHEMVTFIGAGLIAMVLAEVLGTEVEKDPRSSDFGKIKIGRTRIDIWGGFQQIARSTAQLITGKSRAVSSGEIFTKTRLETFGRFIQSKLSPVAGLGIELLSGKDFLGEPLPTFETKGELAYYVMQKLAPLVIQDTVDAIRYSDNKAMTAAAFPLAFHGIGVQTYETNALDDLTQMRDHYSTRVFGKEWKNIGPLSQDALREYKPQIVEQEGIAKFERRNAAFDMKRQREAGVTVEKSLPRDVRKEMDRVAVSVGGLSRTITRNWRLNADLYKKYQDDLSFLLNKVLPRVISKPGYQSQLPEVRQRILEFIIKEAKAAVRKNIVLKANMQDIEDIRQGVEQE
ncbi:hypothetical protein LCGC14_1109240 [marine sediment metagenome]|uniref:Large polyvalent protein associated domain-containing protein n=1 Tax=marine sediment metagenome TaxID=412755 RepID=A0A0F9QDJ7_9ZZZZ